MLDNDKSGPLLEAIVRGIFIGCSVGALAAVIDILPMGRGVALGGICGAFAGITLFRRREKKEEEE